MFQIDQRSRTPIYEQIVNKIKESVLIGLLSPGEKLPSVRDFAQIISVNPNTVQKAFKQLEREGVLTILRSKGTFISENFIDEFSKENISEVKKILKQGVIEAKYLGFNEDKVISIIREIFQDLEGGENLD